MVESTKKGKDYIAGIASGDPRIIEEIYQNFHQPIIQLVTTNNGTVEDAKDVFQEALIFVYLKSKESDFELRHSFLTYLYVVCKNIWSNRMRKNSRTAISLTDDLSAEWIDELEWNEQYRLYRKQFRRLGEGCQRVLELYFDRVSMAEIARRMGFASEGYAKKRKFVCKKKLMRWIQKDPEFKELKQGGA